MSAEESVEFSLPGTWWSLDLRGSEEEVSRRVKILVERGVGRGDQRAEVRRQMRAVLADAATHARSIRADQVHISHRLIGPVPIPMALTVSSPGVSVPASGEASSTAATMLSIVPGEDASIVEHSSLAVVRGVERRTGSSGAPSPVERLMANYWIALPGGRVTIFSFTSPLVTLEKELIILFDAIVKSVRPPARGKVTDESVDVAAH